MCVLLLAVDTMFPNFRAVENRARMWGDGRPERWKLKRQFTKDPGILPTQIPRGLLVFRNADTALSMMNLSPLLLPDTWNVPQEE